MTTERECIDRYNLSIQLIEMQRRVLLEANADRALVDSLSAIIRYLQTLSEFQILRLSGISRTRARVKAKENHNVKKKYREMSLDLIQEILSNARTTRAELELIATERFHVPKGSLRSQGNSEHLREKISVLVQNEKSHEVISAVGRDLKF